MRKPINSALRVLLAALVVFCVGCGPRRDLTRDQVGFIVWYAEDVAHGRNRDEKELDAESPSIALQKASAWLAGRIDEHRQRHLPLQLEARRGRWPALRALVRENIVATQPTGLLALNAKPGADEDEIALAKDLIAAENQDRRMLDLMILSMTDADDRTTRLYAETMRKARQQLDKQEP